MPEASDYTEGTTWSIWTLEPQMPQTQLLHKQKAPGSLPQPQKSPEGSEHLETGSPSREEGKDRGSWNDVMTSALRT
jgi:hypothetical protein